MDPAPDGAALLSSDSRLTSLFEERAEFLSRADFNDWTQITPDNKKVVAKLKSPGAKLLTGPRGSGKSTLLRAAYFDMLDGQTVLPVYVNYARSLALEPLFHRNANALAMFRQWVLLKIVVGVRETFQDLGIAAPGQLADMVDEAERYIDELGAGQEPAAMSSMVSPAAVIRHLERWASEAGRRRVVLLLDDAAHAFSQQQQREFFELFRELRSGRLAAKAAVYPGITYYSPTMHVGNEFELVEAWYRPDADDYLATMRALLQRRLPPSLLARFEGREELVDFLALASFGIPRGFLVMLRQVLGVEEDDESAEADLPTPTKLAADRAVSAYAQSVRDIFSSLADKMPRYRHFVEVGSELEHTMASRLARFNVNRKSGSKAVVIGLSEPLGAPLSRVLAMLEYAGLVRMMDSVSRGEKGVFQRYELHWAVVIHENALSLGRSVSTAAVIDALTARDAHAFVRSRGTTLLGADFEKRCTLDLAPCQNCGTARISEEAQFCMNCGRPLTEASIYEELLKAPIDRLPLTSKKIDGLKEHSAVRTVGDILLDDESREIRQVPYIGPVWSQRIHRYAEEYVSV
jgi:ABC-type hemin transport system ATPase subunit